MRNTVAGRTKETKSIRRKIKEIWSSRLRARVAGILRQIS